MFKRTVWFTIGSATGLASSYYVQRRVRQAAAQLPDRVQREVTCGHVGSSGCGGRERSMRSAIVDSWPWSEGS